MEYALKALPLMSKILVPIPSLSSGFFVDQEDRDKSAAPVFHTGVREGVSVFFNTHFLLRGVKPRIHAYTIHHYADLMKNRSFEPLGMVRLDLSTVVPTLLSITVDPEWTNMGIEEELIVSLLKTFKTTLVVKDTEGTLKGALRKLGVGNLIRQGQVQNLVQIVKTLADSARVPNSWKL